MSQGRFLRAFKGLGFVLAAPVLSALVGCADDGLALDAKEEREENTAGSGNEMVLTAIDVGQGDAILVESGDVRVLIDGGPARDTVADYLAAADIDAIDLVVATHAHTDHIGGIPAVLESVEVGTIWYNGQPHDTQAFERFDDAIEASEATYVEPYRGQSKHRGDLRVTSLHPAESASEYAGPLHDHNIVVRVDFMDYNACSAVITGDIEQSGEEEILESGANVEADVLDLGHHGSHTSSSAEWLYAVSPDIAVVQYGEDNPYDHPHSEVVERIEAAGVDLYGTGEHGTVTMSCDTTGTWSVSTEREGEVVPSVAVWVP